MTNAWADTSYRTNAIGYGAGLGIDVVVVQCAPGVEEFKDIPWRWGVERTFGRLMRHRRLRLARDYETHSHRSEATIGLTGRRLTRESTPNWRDT